MFNTVTCCIIRCHSLLAAWWEGSERGLKFKKIKFCRVYYRHMHKLEEFTFMYMTSLFTAVVSQNAT